MTDEEFLALITEEKELRFEYDPNEYPIFKGNFDIDKNKHFSNGGKESEIWRM